MTEPTKLRQIDSEPVSSTVVEYIEQVLEMAKKGELSSVAMAYVFRDGATGTGFSAAPTRGTLIGAVSILHHKLVRSVD